MMVGIGPMKARGGANADELSCSLEEYAQICADVRRALLDRLEAWRDGAANKATNN